MGEETVGQILTPQAWVWVRWVEVIRWEVGRGEQEEGGFQMGGGDQGRVGPSPTAGHLSPAGHVTGPQAWIPCFSPWVLFSELQVGPSSLGLGNPQETPALWAVGLAASQGTRSAAQWQSTCLVPK